MSETVAKNTASNKPKSTGKDMKPSKTKTKSNTSSSTRSKTKTSATAKKTTEKEDEKQRLADVEKKIRRRVALDEKAFRIVEQLLENPIEEEYLLDVAKHILPSHFADAVEERSIIHQCGYPVCRNVLKNVPKQKYHISLRSNQVYDISERKKFCSNQCFKAARYFEDQLSTTPVWLRNGEQIGPFHLLRREADRGSAGDVLFEVPGQEIAAELQLIDKLDDLCLHKSDKPDDRVTKKPPTKQCKSPTTDTDKDVDGSLQDGNQDILMSDLGTGSGIDVSPIIDVSLVAGDLPEPSDGRDVVVLDIASSSGQTDSTKVLPKTDTPVPSSDIVCCNDMTPSEDSADVDGKHVTRSSGMTPSVEECAPKMDEEQKTEVLMRMLDRRDELQAQLDQHHESVQEAQDCSARSSSPHQVKGVQVLADSGTSQEDISRQDNPADDVACVDPVQVTSSSSDKGQESQESGRDVTVLLRQEDGAKNNINSRADVVSTPITTVISTPITTISKPSSEHGDGISKSTVSGAKPSSVVSEHICVSSSSALVNIQRLRQMQSQKSSKANKPVSPIDTILRAIREWKSAETVTFLHGVDSDDDDDDGRPKKLEAGERLPTAPSLPEKERLFQEKVCQFYRGVYSAGASDPLASSTKKDDEKEIEIVLPPVDSHSQVALRRKIVLDKLTKVLPVLLSPLNLSLTGLVPEIRQLVHTFRLTSENILFRPAEWTLLGLILLKALCVKVDHLRNAFAHTYAVHYIRSFVLSMKINETDVEEVVDFLCSAQVQ